MKQESIAMDPGQSFRFFTWKDHINEVLLHPSDGPPVKVSGMGDQWHFHTELELTFVTEGEGLRFVGDDIATFTAPDLVFIGSLLPHHWQTERSSGFCVQFEFGPSAPLANLRESIAIASLIKRSGRGLAFSSSACTDVREILEECQGAPPVIRLANLLRIFQRLQQARPETLSKTKPLTAELQGPAIQQAVQFIIDHASDETLQLKHVLEHAHISRATFSRHFQAAVGQSYTQFIQNVRLEKARSLLSTTDQSITEIAYESGFSNLSHFNGLFKKRWAMTPRDFRNKIQK